MTRLAAIAALLVMSLSGCPSPSVLDLSVVLPEGPDPLDGVERVRLRLQSPAVEEVLDVPAGGDGSFSIERTIEISGDGYNVSSVVLEGLRGSDVVARGETPPLILRPRDDAFSVLVTRAGAASTLAARWEQPTSAPAAAIVPSLGLLFAGGLDGAGQPSRRVALYDFFVHKSSALRELPEARAGALAASCGGDCALVLLGRQAGGALAQTILRYDGFSWSAIDDDLDASLRRADASMALLSDGRWLVVGGVDGSGTALDSLLRLDPGAPQVSPRLQTLSTGARAARARPAVASIGDSVLVAGGQRPGDALVELWDGELGRSEIVDLGAGAPEDGCAVAPLSDGRFVLIGGRNGDGTLSRDAWLIDPADRSAKRATDVLAEGRAGHHVALLGSDLVVLGGRTASGPSAKVELISSDGFAPAGSTELATARGATTVLRLAPGVLFVAGGDSPSERFEVLQSR